jgi:hypothetical protein
MPFHHALLGKDRMALYAFIQSLNTTFGTSIFEPVALTLAQSNFRQSVAQYTVGSQMSDGAQKEIQDIINQLSLHGNPNKMQEIQRIRNVCQQGQTVKLKTVKADIFLQDHQGATHLIDLKTTKPNAGNWKDFKRTLLEWTAMYLFQYPTAVVHSYIAIPYNPYHPKPYDRWNMHGKLDAPYEFKVAEELWDFLHGSPVHDELLTCFEEVGLEMRDEIDQRFQQFP